MAQAHVERPQLACHLTRTTPETHRLIQENLAETPVYGGWMDSKGPRYCPSIEDKIVRFKDKESHQVGYTALANVFLQSFLRQACALGTPKWPVTCWHFAGGVPLLALNYTGIAMFFLSSLQTPHLLGQNVWVSSGWILSCRRNNCTRLAGIDCTHCQ